MALTLSLATVETTAMAPTALPLLTPPPAPPAARLAPMVATGVTTNWRAALPTIVGTGLTLRALRLTDAPSLLAMLTTEEVARFLSPPPTTVEGFEHFIQWTHRKQAEGTYLCFAVVPRGLDTAVGFFQVRALQPDFGVAEWGFALGRPFWGTGLFVEGATHTLDFTFGTLGVHRLEARAAVANGRGLGALRKMGAVCDAVLRRAFRKDGRVHDQTLWSLLDTDWQAVRAGGPLVSLVLQERLH